MLTRRVSIALLVLVAAVAAACQHGRSDASGPDPRLATLRTQRDSGRYDAELRADSAARRVDSIIVQPHELRLRVGDSVIVGRMVGVWAVDRAGADVAHFAPLFRVRPSAAAQFRKGYLVALAPGATVLEIRGSRFPSPQNPPARPLTLVPITVSR
jgi:hypothetical protein